MTFTGYHDPFMQDKYLRTFILEGKMAAYLQKIDDYLRTPGPVNDYCTLIEEKTKVQRKYIGLGVGILAMGLVFSTLAPLVVNLIAFIYPAYKSIKVILFIRMIYSVYFLKESRDTVSKSSQL